MAIHRGEHRGGLPQQTQTAEVGLQTDLIRVLEGLPQTSGLAHFGHLHSRATEINTLYYYWDPVTWLFPPIPLISLALEGVLEQQI